MPAPTIQEKNHAEYLFKPKTWNFNISHYLNIYVYNMQTLIYSYVYKYLSININNIYICINNQIIIYK